MAASSSDLIPSLSRPGIQGNLADPGRPSLTTFIPQEPKNHNMLIPMEARVHQTSYPIANKSKVPPNPVLFTKPQYSPPPKSPQIVMPESSSTLSRINSNPTSATQIVHAPKAKHPLINYFLPIDSELNNPYGDPKRRIAIIASKIIGLILFAAMVFDVIINFNNLNRFIIIQLFVLASLVGIFLTVGEHMDALKPVGGKYDHLK